MPIIELIFRHLSLGKKYRRYMSKRQSIKSRRLPLHWASWLTIATTLQCIKPPSSSLLTAVITHFLPTDSPLLYHHVVFTVTFIFYYTIVRLSVFPSSQCLVHMWCLCMPGLSDSDSYLVWFSVTLFPSSLCVPLLCMFLFFVCSSSLSVPLL